MQHNNVFAIQPQTNPEAAITRDFGISRQTIDQFKLDAQAAIPGVNLDFTAIYNNLTIVRARYDRVNQAAYFAEVVLYPTHHATLLAYCTCNGELARRFVPEEELNFYEDVVFALDSPSLFVHLSRPVNSTGKLIYFPTSHKGFAREDGWDKVIERQAKQGGGYVPEKAVFRADVRNWLVEHHTYRLTDFFIEPGHNYSTNLGLDLAVRILIHGSVQNVENVFRIIGRDRLLKLKDSLEYHSVFDDLAHNERISAQFIYDLLLQFPRAETPLCLSSWFLRNLFKTGKRDKAVCKQIIQFILDNNIKLKFEVDRFGVNDWIGTGLDDEIRLLMQRGLLTLDEDLTYLRESTGELKLKETHVVTDSEYLQTFIDEDDTARPTPADLTRAVFANHLPAIQFFVERCGMSLTPELLSLAASVRKKPEFNLRDNCYVPDRVVLSYMLQPQFGLVLTQQHFDTVVSGFHQSYNSTSETLREAIAFMLAPPHNLMLTQAAMEKIHSHHAFYISKYLLHRRHPQFAHLHATGRMLATAVSSDAGIEEAMFLSQGQFGLNLSDSRYYRSALHGKRYDLAAYLFGARGCRATQEDIAILVAHKLFDLARAVVREESVKLTADFLLHFIDEFKGQYREYSLDSFTYRLSLPRLAFALRLMREQGVCFDEAGFKAVVGRLYGCLTGIRMMYDYQYEFNRHYDLTFMALADVNSDMGLRRPFRADEKMMVAAKGFANNHNDPALVHEAFDISPRQCILVAMHMLMHPDQYKLHKERPLAWFHLKWLAEALCGIDQAAVDKLSFVEVKQITKYIADAKTKLKWEKPELATMLDEITAKFSREAQPGMQFKA